MVYFKDKTKAVCLTPSPFSLLEAGASLLGGGGVCVCGGGGLKNRENSGKIMENSVTFVATFVVVSASNKIGAIL